MSAERRYELVEDFSILEKKSKVAPRKSALTMQTSIRLSREGGFLFV